MGSDPPFDVRVESRDGAARIAVIGELDMATAPTLGDELVEVERDGVREITVDIGDVTFVDSTGLKVILDGWNRAQVSGHRLALVGASVSARRLCHIAGVGFMLDAPASEDGELIEGREPA